MKIDDTEIRRRANGSIDSDYYMKQCHLERSLYAHRAIDLAFNSPWKLIRNVLLRWPSLLGRIEQASTRLVAKVL